MSESIDGIWGIFDIGMGCLVRLRGVYDRWYGVGKIWWIMRLGNLVGKVGKLDLVCE